MTKTLAVAALMCAFTAGAFAQASAPMAPASAPMAKSHMKKHHAMKHKKTDKGAMPASAASGAM